MLKLKWRRRGRFASMKKILLIILIILSSPNEGITKSENEGTGVVTMPSIQYLLRKKYAPIQLRPIVLNVDYTLAKKLAVNSISQLYLYEPSPPGITFRIVKGMIQDGIPKYGTIKTTNLGLTYTFNSFSLPDESTSEYLQYRVLDERSNWSLGQALTIHYNVIEDLPCPNGSETLFHTDGLEWQRCFVNGQTYNEAKIYCDSLELAGESDWRLPNKSELKGLVICTNGVSTPMVDNTDENGALLAGWGDGTCCPTSESCDYNNGGWDIPTIDPIFSMTHASYPFWTSQLAAPNHAWVVEFLYGSCSSMIQNSSNRSTRCVRTILE